MPMVPCPHITVKSLAVSSLWPLSDFSACSVVLNSRNDGWTIQSSVRIILGHRHSPTACLIWKTSTSCTSVAVLLPVSKADHAKLTSNINIHLNRAILLKRLLKLKKNLIELQLITDYKVDNLILKKRQ